MTARRVPTTFVSFDGAVSVTGMCQRPDRYRFFDVHDPGRAPRIARGGGYSYAATSFGAGRVVQDMRRFNRILRFDPAIRIIEVEAGVTLGDILVAQDDRDLRATAANLAIRHGIRARWMAADAAADRMCAEGIAAAADELGGFDGVLFPIGAVAATDDCRFDPAGTARLLDVNLRHACADSGVAVQFYVLGYMDTELAAGVRSPIPKGDQQALGDLILKHLDRNVGVVYYPWFWGALCVALRGVPWALFKRSRF
jgi:hypothetical protein